MKIIYILNGPNLNLLGTREPEIYGSETLPMVEEKCAIKAKALGLSIDFRQTNIEGELINWIHSSQLRSLRKCICPIHIFGND